jgi:predicted nucleic acid-binding protein
VVSSVSDGVTYDTGALIAAERNDRSMWALHAGFLREEVTPVVPSAVLAEAWRGGPRQARLSHLLALCIVEDLTEEQARAVGVLAGRAGHDDIVDVSVVEGALRRRDAVVTSNPSHIRAVADAAGARVLIEEI